MEVGPLGPGGPLKVRFFGAPGIIDGLVILQEDHESFTLRLELDVARYGSAPRIFTNFKFWMT